MVRQTRRMGFFQEFNPRNINVLKPSNLLEKAKPIEMMVILAVIFIAVGIVFHPLRIFAWLGLMILAVFIIALISWFVIRSGKA